MMLYKNMIAIAHSLHGDTNIFNIVTGVLEKGLYALNMFIIFLIEQTLIDLIKENGFILKKERSKWYLTGIITDEDYADDLAVLADSPAQAEYLLHQQEKAAGGIGLYVNAITTEFMSSKQEGTISILSGKSLKLVDQLAYHGINISSTESDVNIHIVKVWTNNTRLLIIRKCNLCNNIKWISFHDVTMLVLLYRCIPWRKN